MVGVDAVVRVGVGVVVVVVVVVGVIAVVEVVVGVGVVVTIVVPSGSCSGRGDCSGRGSGRGRGSCHDSCPEGEPQVRSSPQVFAARRAGRERSDRKADEPKIQGKVRFNLGDSKTH